MLDPKDPREVVPIIFDFARLSPTVSNPTIDIAVVEGVDPAVADMVIADPVANAGQVLVMIGHGVDGATYRLSCEVDAISAHYVLTDLLVVKAATP